MTRTRKTNFRKLDRIERANDWTWGHTGDFMDGFEAHPNNRKNRRLWRAKKNQRHYRDSYKESKSPFFRTKGGDR